jgi:uncharacterized membrane protein
VKRRADSRLTVSLNHRSKEIIMSTAPTTTTTTLVQAALAGLVLLGTTGAPTQAMAAKGDTEKCAGIVKAGANDCGTSKSACAGTAKTDRDGEAWILVPKGTCAKIAGGRLTDKPENVHGGAAALMPGKKG